MVAHSILYYSFGRSVIDAFSQIGKHDVMHFLYFCYFEQQIGFFAIILAAVVFYAMAFYIPGTCVSVSTSR